MAKHKLYREFANTPPLTLSPSEEISPVRHVHPSSSRMVTPVRRKVDKSKCADTSVTSEKSANDKRVTNEKTNFTLSESLPGGACVSVSDSDSDDFSSDNFCKHGVKLPYSAKEDEWILKFVLKGQNVSRVGSLSLWRQMENEKENPKRTYQSLKNRFLRNIKPNIFTRYGHLITSNTEIERITAKFPELKFRVGGKNTFSRIQLPARNPHSKPAESALVNGSWDNDERVASPSTSTPNGQPCGSARREPILNLHAFSNFKRNVTVMDNSLAVLVKFTSKEQLHKPVTPSMGIYETFKKFKKKNKLVLCSSCGRYNKPKKNKLTYSSGDGKSLNCSAGRQEGNLIANSSGADSGRSSVTNSGSPSAKHRKTRESEPRRPYRPFSPSLVKEASEDRGLPVRRGIPDEPPETDAAGQAPETPDAVASRQEADSAAADRLRETDDLDSTYDDTVIDLKKLIKNEEERLLVKRCLNGKAGILGLSDSLTDEMSMESYFVDLSPNVESPVLTDDYPTLSPTANSESSLLARNMMKMLEENKTSKES